MLSPFSEIIIVQEDVDRRCWCPVFEHEPGPLLVHCVHHYKLITAVAASPAAAHSRPTLGVSCKLSKSNLSVCSILFTPVEFIHIFITLEGDTAWGAGKLKHEADA